MGNYFRPEIECASREQIKAWQDERLVKTVKHVYDNVPYYRNLMEQKGVTPGDIKSTEDLHKLPFLTKDDLREAYPYGLLAVPLHDCVRIQSTSGTTGKRVVAFIPSMISICGMTAAPERLLRQAERQTMWFRYAMVTVCLPGDRGSMEVLIKSVP